MLIASLPVPLKLRHSAPLGRARWGAAFVLSVSCVSATIAQAETAGPDILEPTEIDRAVRAFTGAPIGEIGGARASADRRLRLAACATPLTTTWHGTNRTAVKVECSRTKSAQSPWRIFVATRPAEPSAPGRARTIQSAPIAPQIKRGDPITVIVRGRGFTVQQAGEAMENGRVGDWIGVRTARQAEPVRARIERPGLAIIPIG